MAASWRGYSFGSNEPSIAFRPGLKHAIVIENNGARGVEIQNEIFDVVFLLPERRGGS